MKTEEKLSIRNRIASFLFLVMVFGFLFGTLASVSPLHSVDIEKIAFEDVDSEASPEFGNSDFGGAPQLSLVPTEALFLQPTGSANFHENRISQFLCNLTVDLKGPPTLSCV